MSLDTYANLQASIADFLDRDDLSAVIPDFIRLAEGQFQRDIEHWRMEKRDTLAVSGQYTDLPSDWVKPIRLQFDGAKRALVPITQAEMQDKRYSNGDASGEGVYYCVTAGQIEIFPTPTGTSLNVYYVGKIPVLSDANTTNWLLDEAPGVYLYGALSQSAPYLKDDERLIIWSTLYTNAVNALNMASQDAKWGGQGIKLRA